jgi:transposase
MRFVAIKTPEQQSCLMLHRTRHLFIRQQTAVINAIRAHLAEFGIVAPVGRNGVEQHQTSALAHGFVGAAAHQGRCDRARQQDCKNGVGHDGQTPTRP